MTDQPEIFIVEVAQPSVEISAGVNLELQVVEPAAATIIEVNVSGPQGPIGETGPTGIVTATTPLNYDEVTKTLSINLALVATSGSYDDLISKPTLGTAAPLNVATSGDASSSQVVKGNDSRLNDVREWSAATVTQVEAEVGTSTSRLAFTPQRVFQAIAAWWSASTAAAKLAGIASGATANATDAQLRDRATHTGTQSASTITGLATVATSGAYSDLTGRPDLSLKADLVNGLVPSAQLPSYVDDVLEFANVAAFPETGETGKIYVSLATNRCYRWSGSTYIEIAASPGSTDAVPEGSVNLYFTAGRAAAAAPVQSVAGRTGNVTLSSSDVSGLGTAATQNVGTSAGNVVQLDGSARLPAVDGSQLTGIVTTTDLGYTPSTRVLTSSTGADVTLPLVSSTDPGLLSAADKLKLDGIAAGAEVNVNADWNASSGDAQILNKPTLGTAAAQNVGTAAGDVVQLDGSARLPAVDGSQLTGINATTNLSYTPSTRLLESSTGTDVTLPLFATNSTDAGLVPGNSSASTTQFLRGDGTWAVPAGGYDALVDASTAGTLYVGRATLGTAQSTAAWTIVKSTFSAAGVRLTKGTATGVAWTGRTSATYT